MSKADLRRVARQRLASMAPSDRTTAGEAIASRLLQLPLIAGARTILLYSALPEEVPTRPISKDAWTRGVVVTYPRCLPETREMMIHRVEALSDLQIGAYGIAEPSAACPLTRLADIDVALVPGLGWDRKGGRLGRGGGYYDRLLAHPEFRGVRCGIFFSVQEMDELPMEQWDVRLDLIVTERETIRTR